MKLNVWYLRMYHSDDGESPPSLYPTEEAAKAVLYAYVHEQWNEGEMGDAEFPGNEDEAIAQYFEAHDYDEWYELGYRQVHFPWVAEAPTDPDIVDLTDEELSVVICALKTTSSVAIARKAYGDDVSTTRAMEVDRTRRTAIDKLSG